MAVYYLGVGGNDGSSGLSYALRKLTMAGIEALSLVAGDVVRIAPGTYREKWTTSHSGGSNYSTGTVDVVNGSAVITGHSTLWLANAFADGQFQSAVLAHGTDGVTNGTATFTSSAGNFQAGHVGMTIRINTKAAYIISAVASLTSITLKNIDGSAPAPAAGSSLVYDVGPEAPIEILSVDSNTQITLKRPWAAPSFNGIAYTVWRDIKFIGDELGTLTDGAGGGIRFTGSDNDQTATRAQALVCANNYLTFRGIRFDTTTGDNVQFTGGNLIFEQCTCLNAGSQVSIDITGAAATSITIRRCLLDNELFFATTSLSNVAGLLENLIICRSSLFALAMQSTGGVLIRNVTISGCVSGGIRNFTAPATGQANTINNCLIAYSGVALQAPSVGILLEDYNNLFGNVTARTNVTAGAHSQAYQPGFAVPLLTLGIHQPTFDALESASPLSSIAGFNPPYDDFYGTVRAATSSWGAVQYEATRRPNDAGYSAGRRMGAT